MNGLETIGIFSVITLITLFIWFMLFIIDYKGSDDEVSSFIFTSIIIIVALIMILTVVTSEYVGDERKIDEYKEKLSKYEKMEIENESNN